MKPSRRHRIARSALVLLRDLLVSSAVIVNIANAQGAPPADNGSSALRSSAELENAAIKHILERMMDADQTALFDAYQSNKDPLAHAIAAMAIERTRFNLDAATKDAKICEDSLIGEKPGFALFCAQFRIGNLRLAGQAGAANQLVAKTIERFRGHHVDAQLAAMQKALDREANLPAFSLDPIASDVEIKLKRDIKTPTFEASANGHGFDLTLDTGASDLVLSQNYAERFGVKLLDQTGKANGLLSRNVAEQSGVLATLQIGSITLRNVPARVIPTRDIALFGANLAATLGTLRITRSSLHVFGEHSAAPACTDPMQVGSDVAGHYMRVIPTLLINDTPQSVLLDTGAGFFLVGSKAAVDEVKKIRSGHTGVRDVGGSHVSANAEAAKVKLQIGKQPFLVYFIVYTDSEMKYAITLGGAALSEMDFMLDFRHQSLCFSMHDSAH